MKINDYVRFKYPRVSVPVQIAKIISVDYDKDEKYYFYTTDNFLVINKEDIIREPSINLIDLLEEGDYIRTVNDTDFRRIYMSYGKLVIYKNEEIPIETFKNDFISEILTKEQINEIAYKINNFKSNK